MAYHYCDNPELPAVDPMTQITEWNYQKDVTLFELFNTNIPELAASNGWTLEETCKYINIAQRRDS